MPRAFAAAGRGAIAEAEALCRAVLAAEPGHFEALFLLGTLAGRAGRAEESARILAQAVARHGGSANAHNNLGNALQALRRFDEALASYDRALAVKPDHGDAHYNRGIVQAVLARHADALASYDRALALRPEHVDAHANRGLALRELGARAGWDWLQHRWHRESAELEYPRYGDRQPTAPLIGWFGNGSEDAQPYEECRYWYLIPRVTFRAVKRFYRATPRGFPVTSVEIKVLLYMRGLLFHDRGRVFGHVLAGMDVLESLDARDTSANADLPPGDLILSVTIEQR